MRLASVGLAWTIALALRFSGGSETAVSVEVLNHGGHANFADATFTARRGTHVIQAPLDGNGRANAAVSAGTWEVSCEGPNVHCPPTVRTIRGKELKIDGFGLTVVAVSVMVPADSELPNRLSVQGIFSVPENRNSGQRFEYRTVAKLEGNKATFRIPTSRHDLRLAAEGFAPAYRWAFAVAAGRHEMGELSLRPGSSLFGVAFEPGTDTPASDVEIRLEPLGPSGLGSSAQLLTTTARTSSRGAFQMTGLSPSRYRLVLLRQGRAVGGMAPIEIPPNSEVRLDAIRLNPPAAVQLTLTPPLTLSQKPWRVSLKQLSPDLLGVPMDISSNGSPEGVVRFAGVPSGPYQLFIRDEKGSRIFFEKIEIEGDLSRVIDLPVSTISGRVRLGSSALKAQVTLGGGSLDQASFESDEQGQFEGTIRTPARGVLFATVESLSPPFSRKLVIKNPRVDVEGRTVQVEIDLEDRVIEGRVIAAAGVGVPGISVLAVADQFNMIETTSRADGSFELRPADSAVYSVSLRRSGKGIGKTHEVDLTSTERQALLMSIGQYRRGQLRLTSAGGEGVRGARVYVKPAGHAGQSLQTDATGVASLVWPQGVERGFVSAMSESAPGLSQCVSVHDPDPSDPQGEVELAIVLPPSPGARIRLLQDKKNNASGSAEAIIEEELFLVSRSGGLLRRTEVDALNLGAGIAPGDYAALWHRGAAGALADALCSTGPRAGLRWNPVGPGQDITISVTLPTKRPPTGR